MLRPLTLSLAVLCGIAAPCGQASAAEAETRFFSAVAGEWTGPGEIIAGKYKGTKFICRFTGSSGEKKPGMTLDGACRVGMISQKMSATIEKDGRAGYKGSFLDGAAGKGLDVVAGRVDGSKVTLSLVRNKLKGAMLARLPDENSMSVTVSVRVEDQLVPVIGMDLKRVDAVTVGSIARD